MAGEGPLGLGAAGAEHAGSELAGDLNRSRTDAAGPADDEHPVALADLDAVGEHVHRGAAGQG